MTESPQIPVIRAENLVKRFGFFRPITPVDGVSLQINSGEIVSLLGTNGAGKSTTFDMLSGLTTPTGGTISLYDEKKGGWINITKMPLYQRAKHGICYLPQKPSVFASLTARQNLLGIMEIMSPRVWQEGMKSLIHSSGSLKSPRWKSAMETREEFCDALLEEFGLYERRNEKVTKLSGGEKRRLEIARCFIQKPRLILMDEPFAAVDVNGIKMCAAIFPLVRDVGVSILIIDHRQDEILTFSNRAIVLNKGHIIREGPSKEIQNDSKIVSLLKLKEPVKEKTQESHELPSKSEPSQVFDSTSVRFDR